jgi:hypothetical protein
MSKYLNYLVYYIINLLDSSFGHIDPYTTLKLIFNLFLTNPYKAA